VKPSSVAFLSVFALFWSSITLWQDYVAAREIAGGLRSRSFVKTSGEVSSSTLTPHTGKGVSYTADLVYEYTVNGRTFTGSKVGYGGWTGRASDVVDAHPAGSAAVVFFDPANPSDAVLETGLSGRNLFATVLLAPFNVLTIGIWSWIIAGAGASKTASVAGGVGIVESAPETRVRMSQLNAFESGMLALVGTSFAVLFLVGLSTDSNPSVNMVIAAWGGILGASALVFTRRWRRIQSGVEDLVIDAGARALTLPQTFGRKESITAPFREVQAVTVEKVARSSRRRRASSTRAPTLQFKDGRPGEILAEWSSNEKAEAFAGWLREKIGVSAKS